MHPGLELSRYIKTHGGTKLGEKKGIERWTFGGKTFRVDTAGRTSQHLMHIMMKQAQSLVRQSEKQERKTTHTLLPQNGGAMDKAIQGVRDRFTPRGILVDGQPAASPFEASGAGPATPPATEPKKRKPRQAILINGQWVKRVPNTVWEAEALAVIQADPLRVWSLRDLAKKIPANFREHRGEAGAIRGIRVALMQCDRVSMQESGRGIEVTLRKKEGVDFGRTMAAAITGREFIAEEARRGVEHPTPSLPEGTTRVAMGLPSDLADAVGWALEHADSQPMQLAITLTRIQEWHKKVHG